MKAPRPLLNASAAASFFLFLGTVPLSAAEWAFDFGTPGSRTRDGFTKVTKAQLYSRERGHGFESSEGLTGVDRSGNYPWKKGLHSSDARRRRVYGAYRVSSYSTCDFVEGRRDNAFLLNVPDGEYEVWAVVADPAHAPPFFELRANRETKHSVRMGRHGFVFVEPFRVRAEDGVLRVDLTGPHGWLLNALVVGTPGPGLQAITGDLERDIFFSYPEHLKDWVKLKQESIHPPPELTPAEEARGYVTFARDYTVKVFPFTYPERSEIDRPMTAFATPGEFEPATIAIYPFRDVGVVDVELTDFTSTDGRRISRDRVEVGIVRCWPQRRLKGSGPSGHYAIEPELIEPPCGRIRNVVAGEAKQWWFTVHVPEDAEPGQYRAQVTVKPAGAPHMQVEWRLLVLPFALARPVDRHWGTWLDTFPPLAGLRGPAARGRNTPAEVERLARLEMEDFRDHGFDVAILECSSIGVAANDDGTFSYDISRLRRQMEFLQILGKGSVVPICFEYLCRRLEYRFADESKEEHEPGTFSAKARASIVGLVQHLESERKANNWPRFLYLPIDEPGNSKTENRMTFGKNVLEMVQSVTGAQTACTITARGVRQLGDRINTRIYANGHVSREIARADAEKGFPYWYYANGIVYGASTVSSRNYTGFEFLRSGAECVTGWGFAAYHCNPYNDLDGMHTDWCVQLPGPDGPIPTIYWELCREGVDDCRYVATLQEQIAKAGKRNAAARARAVLRPLLAQDASPITQPAAFHRHRWRVAREILNLSGTDELMPSLSFTPVGSSSVLTETLQDNIIENPSFENEPQPDGLPGWPYPYTDAYTKAVAKPSGAISVTEEIAHEGRRSLKWDFRKSKGKGAEYGGRHYLIINVQVAKELIPELRGRRARIGMWVRLGGGTVAPGFKLRAFGTRDGKYGYLDGIAYQGGIEDVSVWNRYEAVGTIPQGAENIDIHIYSRIPTDPVVRDQSAFYIDEVSLRPLTPVPVKLETPLEEVYVGESIAWRVSTAPPAQRLAVSLLLGGERLQEATSEATTGLTRGAFPSANLPSGVYRLQASCLSGDHAQPHTVWREVIVAPDPFAW